MTGFDEVESQKIRNDQELHSETLNPLFGRTSQYPNIYAFPNLY